MGFCSEDEVEEFFRSVPKFERMFVRSSILLIKYWLSVSHEEQEKRFQDRIDDPAKHWKLSPMDLESRTRWVQYFRVKNDTFRHTDIKQAPRHVVHADTNRRARLNCIHHLLSTIPYEDPRPTPVELPPVSWTTVTCVLRLIIRDSCQKSFDPHSRTQEGRHRSIGGARSLFLKYWPTLA